MRRSKILFIFLLAFIFPFNGGSLNFCPAAAQAQPPGKPLTNDDIISLVKAGLSDAAIVSAIQKSPTQFDISPEALVKLKKAGVNNAVIEAMIAGGSSSTAGEAKTPLIPAAYGYYIVDENQLLEVKAASVTTKIGIRPGGPRSGNAGVGMDGFPGEPSISIKSKFPIFIVYQQGVDIRGFQLRDLVYTKTEQAYRFNYFKTGQAFFRNTYFVDYYDTIQIDLWRPNKEIQLRIEPVEGKTGMFRLIPQSSLNSGKYTLYFGDDIHPDGTIFVAKPGRQTSAFYFRIE